MEIGKPKRVYTVEPVKEPVPRTTTPDAPKRERPPVRTHAARA